jgi:hypothetical protein
MGVPIDCLPHDSRCQGQGCGDFDGQSRVWNRAFAAFHKIQPYVKRALLTYPQAFPDGGPFAFLEEEEENESRQGVQIAWDIFVLLVKVGLQDRGEYRFAAAAACTRG